MLKTIVCLANSRKISGRCIAGKEYNEASIGGWIRPVSSLETEAISMFERRYEKGQTAELLDIIEIPFLRHNPNKFQAENYLIDNNNYWEKKGEFPVEELKSLCDHPKLLWQNGYSSSQGSNDKVPEKLVDEIDTSLYLITPDELRIMVRSESTIYGSTKRKVRAHITYNENEYILVVTDILVEQQYLAKEDGEYTISDPLDRVFICVSLTTPLNGYCYKLTASLIGL